MGIWAGIKYAINNTLGTNDFKPLNKIMEDLIMGQKRLVASDDVLAVIVSGTSGVDTNKTKTLGTFTPKVSGSIRFFATANSGSSITPGKIYLRDEDENNIAFFDITSNNNYDYFADVNVIENKIYRIIYTRGSSMGGNASSIQIRGSIVDAYTFDYTVTEV